MNKQKLLNKLDNAWEDFQESYTGLTDDQLLEPGVTGDWSIRDLLAHVSWWEEEALKHLPHNILSGKPLPRYSILYGGIDAFNALMRDQKSSLSLIEVRKEAAETHQRLVDYINNVPEEQIVVARFQRRLRLDTYSHYPIHARAIRAWRECSGLV